MSLPPPVPYVAAGILAVLLVGALLAWYRAATRVRRGNRGRQRIAARGEARAIRLLERAGYRVVDRQVTRRWRLYVDGQAVEVSARADLLVRRRGRLWVAEVKTGAVAPDPTCPATRRQLLEYLHAFDVHGALLVDMEAERIHEVGF